VVDTTSQVVAMRSSQSKVEGYSSNSIEFSSASNKEILLPNSDAEFWSVVASRCTNKLFSVKVFAVNTKALTANTKALTANTRALTAKSANFVLMCMQKLHTYWGTFETRACANRRFPQKSSMPAACYFGNPRAHTFLPPPKRLKFEPVFESKSCSSQGEALSVCLNVGRPSYSEGTE
jgi:hypothetical protein